MGASTLTIATSYPTKITLPSAVRAACMAAADRTGLTISGWTYAALDAAAGLPRARAFPRVPKAHETQLPYKSDATITIWISPERADAYLKAATEACASSVNGWINMVLATASGASAAYAQLSRVAPKS